MMPPEAEKERRLVYALRMLAEQTSQAQPPAELEARLLARMRQPRSLRPGRWAWVVATAAAVVLLMVTPGSPTRHAPASPVEDVTAVATAAMQESDADALTPWYVDGTLPAAESGNVVRMQVSRTAAAAYGAPLPDSQDASLQAELFIGDDGMARAIRFVR